MKKILLFLLLILCFVSKASHCEEDIKPQTIAYFYEMYKSKKELDEIFLGVYAQGVKQGFIHGVYYAVPTRNEQFDDCFWDTKMKLIVDGVFRDYQDGLYEPNMFFATAFTNRLIKYCTNKIENKQNK